jgi:hypothetical protein
MIEDARLTRKRQKNASPLIEFNISASHLFKKDWLTNPESKAALDRYFKESKQFIRDTYGDHIIATAIHFDERTPHLHVLCVPLVDNGKGGIKFSSNEFIGGRSQLRQAHTDFFKQVGEHLGLQRGTEGSRTTHRELADYHKWLESEREAFEKERRELEEQKARTALREQEAADRAAALARKQQQQAEFEKNIERFAPVVPVPPALNTAEDRRKWQGKIQEAMTGAFRKLQTLCVKIQAELERWKRRALKAEHDLAVKPVEEILSDRKKLMRDQNQSLGTSR